MNPIHLQNCSVYWDKLLGLDLDVVWHSLATSTEVLTAAASSPFWKRLLRRLARFGTVLHSSENCCI